MTTKTVSEIAAHCGATLEGDGKRVIQGIASLGEAEGADISFLANPRYRAELDTTRAGAVIVPEHLASDRRDVVLLRAPDPNRAFTRVIELFLPARRRPGPGVHPTAAIDAAVELGAGVHVGANCVVEGGSVLDEGVCLHAGVLVGRDVRIGPQTEIHPGVVLYPGVRIGARCIVHAGTVIGSDGFGFEPTATGWEKIPQCGWVDVHDDVEIGANCTIDRGRFGATVLGAGAKLDNLVQVAHNVQVGPGALLIAQVGIAGSSEIGARAILAGQVGVAGHVKIGAGARVSAQSGVGKDLPPGQDFFGSPVRPQREALRILTSLGRLPEMPRTLRELERRVAELEERSK